MRTCIGVLLITAAIQSSDPVTQLPENKVDTLRENKEIQNLAYQIAYRFK